MKLQPKELELFTFMREMKEMNIGKEFFLTWHFIPIDRGSEEHIIVASHSQPIPIQRVREPMKNLLKDIKKGLPTDALFLIQYDSNFELLKLFKLSPTIK